MTNQELIAKAKRIGQSEFGWLAKPYTNTMTGDNLYKAERLLLEISLEICAKQLIVKGGEAARGFCSFGILYSWGFGSENWMDFCAEWTRFFVVR